MGRDRLLLLLSRNENRRILIERLSSAFEIVLPKGDTPQTTTPTLEDFDLIICDLVKLGEWKTPIREWREMAEPLILPVLTLMSRNIVGTLPADVRYQIDELVTIPIDPSELEIRIAILLRSRRLSAELSQKNQTLQELDALRTRFVSVVSHELRSPLSVITGVAQILQLKEKKYSAEKKKALLQRILKVIDRLTVLLDDLLLLTRNTSSQATLKPQAINLEQHCQRIIDNFKLSTSETRTIHFQSEGNLSDIGVDTNLIETILSNLLSNALKYSPIEASVSLHIYRQGEEVVLTVSDHGQGIPLVDQPNLFEPFFRARNVGTIPGTGLGLNILKQCVDLHRGQISVESELDRGTTFTVVLPVFETTSGSETTGISSHA
ncbi:HAMP domain-containing sensor histidine kinase [cf. Phormidesmis sp. LEGE 11477]|uniref:ATP-binding protein n=1 Tax=cf. Phormidesmis sp. LEGE 11477 TaxID=1828680 RepID=UPI0018829CEF|nr:HAMP domain-containing sensor histidine kinase [cf. Phormidesmis sp. LEGE 11477]MBE9059554.1 HAMP domain-containing histidine kinase [cf. Phormidesmis sp. LEGE 11477]